MRHAGSQPSPFLCLGLGAGGVLPRSRQACSHSAHVRSYAVCTACLGPGSTQHGSFPALRCGSRGLRLLDALQQGSTLSPSAVLLKACRALFGVSAGGDPRCRLAAGRPCRVTGRMACPSSEAFQLHAGLPPADIARPSLVFFQRAHHPDTQVSTGINLCAATCVCKICLTSPAVRDSVCRSVFSDDDGQGLDDDPDLEQGSPQKLRPQPCSQSLKQRLSGMHRQVALPCALPTSTWS